MDNLNKVTKEFGMKEINVKIRYAKVEKELTP